jgi:hypothetical protein
MSGFLNQAFGLASSVAIGAATVVGGTLKIGVSVLAGLTPAPAAAAAAPGGWFIAGMFGMALIPIGMVVYGAYQEGYLTAKPLTDRELAHHMGQLQFDIDQRSRSRPSGEYGDGPFGYGFYRNDDD